MPNGMPLHCFSSTHAKVHTMQNPKTLIEILQELLANEDFLDKHIVMANLERLKAIKAHILITGATGSGKSSTINALFGCEKARVGQGSTPETQSITRYDLNNLVLFDSPGLGDGAEADIRHAKAITDTLLELDAQGQPLIDLALVVLDGSTRDMGTSFELINNVVIPALGKDTSRLLVAINQADMAMKGRHWNHEANCPEPELERFLEEKSASVHQRIKEATGVDTQPIYYVAGYKDGNHEQRPYNLSKMLAFLLRHVRSEKRAAFANDLNQDKRVWQDDDRLENYRAESKKSILDSIGEGASKGAAAGASVGSVFGKTGEVLGAGIGAVIGGIGGLFGLW